MNIGGVEFDFSNKRGPNRGMNPANQGMSSIINAAANLGVNSMINAAANQVIQTLGSLGVQSHVATEKMSYRPGEVVTGKVWIHSMVPIPMQSVVLKISGFESTRVIERKYIHDEVETGYKGFNRTTGVIEHNKEPTGRVEPQI